jgi:hypothetical protein
MVVMRSAILMVLVACSYQPPTTPEAPLAPDAPDSPVDFDPNACPSTFEPIGNLTSRYFVANAFASGQGRDWFAAADTCVGMASSGPATHLVVFDTAEERRAVWDHFAPRTGFRWIWTGTFRVTGEDDTFMTVFGQVSEPAWAPGEPREDRPGDDGNVAVAHGTPADEESDGDLRIPRHYNLDFLCECDGLLPSAAP